MGHYHLGIDTGCLPPGEIIPEGQGWVHFGDGSNVFTLQVEPAAYELTLQIGDDLHVTQGRPLRDHQHRDRGRHLGRSA